MNPEARAQATLLAKQMLKEMTAATLVPSADDPELLQDISKLPRDHLKPSNNDGETDKDG